MKFRDDFVVSCVDNGIFLLPNHALKHEGNVGIRLGYFLSKFAYESVMILEMVVARTEFHALLNAIISGGYY